jgi:hypothetical protein
MKRELYSDAAGLLSPDQLWKGPGCGGAGLSEEAIIALAYQLIWPSEFVRSAKDECNSLGD